MKVLFMGTPQFAVPCLEKLAKNYDVVGVITQPDKPKGRGYQLSESPVKETAIKLNIPVFQPVTLKDNAILELLNDLKPDIIVVTAYGKILPEYVLNYPKMCCINIHASILPKLRGAAPIQWAIMNGEKESGITSIYMEKGIDTGDMILNSYLTITDNMTGGELHDKLSVLGAENLIETLNLIKNGNNLREKQNDMLSSYAPMLNKEIAKIDFNDKTVNIINKIRALNPFPGAYFMLDGKQIKVYNAKKIDLPEKPTANTIMPSKNFIIAASDGFLDLVTIKPEGKREMSGAEFVLGRRDNSGTVN